jgi:hypothetical protein
MTDLNPVDAMTTDYRALCAELIEAVLSDDSHIDCVQIARRARALLDQPVAEVPKPVVDYSRVPEMATEAQKACDEWLFKDGYDVTSARLRAARRPKPPSLKEQALELVRKIEGTGSPWALSELGVVRRALEALDD